jgi:hypothetical protein
MSINARGGDHRKTALSVMRCSPYAYLLECTEYSATFYPFPRDLVQLAQCQSRRSRRCMKKMSSALACTSSQRGLFGLRSVPIEQSDGTARFRTQTGEFILCQQSIRTHLNQHRQRNERFGSSKMHPISWSRRLMI